MLKVENLSHGYENFNLEPLSFELESAYVLGILGENGAGKSTLIKLVAHELAMQDGSITLNGKKDYRSEMAYVPSYIPFNLNYKIKELEKMMSLFYQDWDFDAFNLYCEKYELDKNIKLSKLSLGMKQRLTIALALSHKAKLVILDEATEGIDPFIREEIINDLREYLYRYKACIIVASHNLKQYENLIDHLLYLENGRVLVNDDILSFKENAHKYLKEPLESVSLTDFSLARQKEQNNVGN